MKILLRHNFVDVLWDDGKKERMLSIDVPTVKEPKSHEMYRIGMVVVAEQTAPDSKRYGIVQVSEDLGNLFTTNMPNSVGKLTTQSHLQSRLERIL